jgi:hypothetical protein
MKMEIYVMLSDKKAEEYGAKTILIYDGPVIPVPIAGDGVSFGDWILHVNRAVWEVSDCCVRVTLETGAE